MKIFLLLAGTVLSVKPRFLHEPEKPELSLVDAKKAEIFGPRFEIDDELPDRVRNDAGIFSSFLFMIIFCHTELVEVF